MNRCLLPLFVLLLTAANALTQQTTVTIAILNSHDTLQSSDTLVLKRLSSKFEEQNPGIKLNWVELSEALLRQRVKIDLSQDDGQFDVVYLPLYDVPIFAKNGWLKPLENIPVDYDIDDVFKSIRDGFSYDGRLYALPFYGESSMLMYRKDLFAAKGLKMPEQPTYHDIKQFADVLTDREKGVYGILLRSRPGWTENMIYSRTIERGFAENLRLFAEGHAAMWIDSTSAGWSLHDLDQPGIFEKIAFANAPTAITPNGSSWLWSLGFAITKSARFPEAAQKFVLWATSKEYVKVAAADSGWAAVPRGTRKSTYRNLEYQRIAPFAEVAQHAIETADSLNPSTKGVPYIGVQDMQTLAFGDITNSVEQEIVKVLAGQENVNETLRTHQALAEQAVNTDAERQSIQESIPGSQVILASAEGPATAAASPPADDSQVTVFYATNRVPKPDSEEIFSAERSQKLVFGYALVQLPGKRANSFLHSFEKVAQLFVIGPLFYKSEDDQKFDLLACPPLSQEEFVQDISKDQTSSALLYVHGIGASFKDALYGAADIKHKTGFTGSAVAFSWPSKKNDELLAPLLNYNYDHETAEFSQDAFMEVLRLLQTKAHISKIYIVAHSMGNQIVLGSIYHDLRPEEKLALSEVVLAEPDVPWESFKKMAPRIKGLATGVTLYASSTDSALGMSSELNGEKRAGFFPKSEPPLVVSGIDTIDVSLVGENIFAFQFNHDIALKAPFVLVDVSRLLGSEKNKHPPNKRSEGIYASQVGTKGQPYWTFPSHLDLGAPNHDVRIQPDRK
jgi:sorbitol/mannitol transport system substrate-binding protein